MTIRDARPADRDALAALAARAFRAAFGAQNDPADLDAYVGAAFDARQCGAELADPALRVLLAEDADGLRGYATLRDGAVDACVTGPAPLEVWRLYAAPEAVGQGVGAALMGACLDAARAMNRETVWLGVWDQNPRAIAFYERWGFRTVGSHGFRLGEDHQTDLVMARPTVLPG